MHIFLKSPVILFLVTGMVAGCDPGTDESKIRDLESLTSHPELLEKGIDPGAGENLFYILQLYESIDHKELIPALTVKRVGIRYLYGEERNRAESVLGGYLKHEPDDGEALFYLGIIHKINKKDYCEDFRRANILGYKPSMELIFTWNLDIDDCF